MKKHSAFEKVAEVVIGFILASFIVLFVMVVREVVWPVLKFFGKASFKMFLHVLAKARVVKVKSSASTLPTPDIFKGSTNLAKAKQVRL